MDAAHVVEKKVVVTDIVGEFGAYQFLLNVLAFCGYFLTAVTSNMGPLIAPDVDFKCDQLPSNAIINNSSDSMRIRECFFKLPSNNETLHCQHWTFNTTTTGRTLTSEFSMVCQNEWQRSAFQSSVSAGITVASLLWGTCSDYKGRAWTIRVTYIVSFTSGLVSVFAPNLFLYTALRSICGLGSLGLAVSLATIIVETTGNRYRGLCCVIIYLGWSMGVMVMPWLYEYFNDFHHLTMFTVLLHAALLPLLLLIKESIRWLLIKGRFDAARDELLRIKSYNTASIVTVISKRLMKRPTTKNNNQQLSTTKINTSNNYSIPVDTGDVATHKSINADTESSSNNLDDDNLFAQQFEQLVSRFKSIRCVHEQTSAPATSKLFQVLQSRSLLLTTITIVWTSFNGEMLYMAYILLNTDVGSRNLNYLIGGFMEVVATIFCGFILTYVPRRASIVAHLISISLISLALAITHQELRMATIIMSLAKLVTSALTSINYVVVTEAYPTDLRQSGFGICGTLGSLGAVVAPFICNELADATSKSTVFILFAVISLSPIVLIVLFLRDTKDAELPDSIDEL